MWLRRSTLCVLQVATAVEKWKAAIREAQTFSRMHVLLGMLDASVKWDMSAENARCKVCRRKGECALIARLLLNAQSYLVVPGGNPCICWVTGTASETLGFDGTSTDSPLGDFIFHKLICEERFMSFC